MRNFNFLKVATIFMGLTLLFNACSEDPVAPPVAPPIVKPITTIADLKAKWVDADITIAEEVYIEGVVTLTPLEKNIPDFVTYIQDETGGIAITLEKESLNILEKGMKVRVGGTGIQLKKFNGLLQFGNLKLQTGYLVSKDNVVTPKVVTLADVLAGKYIGELVEIKNVEFEKAGTFNGTNGNNTLTDCTSKATVYTRSACTFAGEALPAGNGSFVGVVSAFNSIQLLVRTPSDLVMTGERCGGSVTPPTGSIFSEAFSSGLGSFKGISVLGDQVWSHSTQYSCALMTGYVSASKTNFANEDWLVSPVIDLSSAKNPALTFNHAANYFKDLATLKTEITVWASTSFNGSTIVASEWKQIPITDINQITNTNFTFLSSGEMPLTEYKGQSKVYIAFKYLSTEAKAGTWEVKEMSVAESTTDFNQTKVEFTSNAVTSVASGTAYKYDITTQVVNGVGATTISATGLPAWATLTNNGDGTATITGTAPTVTEDQSSQVVVTATNNSISQVQNFTLTVKAPTAGGEGDGSAGAPYTVAQAIQKQGENQKFVKGYVVGIVKNGVATYNTPADAIFSGTFDSSTNVFIADSADETDPKKCINVKLNDNPSAVPTMRNLVNLKDHPENKGKILTVEGDLKAAYTNLFGIRTIKSFDLK